MKLKWEQLEKVLEIFKKIEELPQDYGKKYSYELHNYYINHEYVFGFTLKCDLGGNLKIEDYVSVLFNDMDKNEIDINELDKIIEGIDEFRRKVKNLKIEDK